jgi:proline racemase
VTVGAPFTVRAVDSHTEGMPTRVVVEGVGELPGAPASATGCAGC